MVHFLTIFSIIGLVAPIFGENPFSALPSHFVDISAKGSEVWGLDRFHSVYRFGNGAWVLYPLNVTGGGSMNGAPGSIGASPDGWTWIVTNTTYIYRWNMTTQRWDPMNGYLSQINAISRDTAIGTEKGGVWIYKNKDFEQVPFEGYAIWAAIGDNDERWIVDKNNWLYRWNKLTEGGWTRMPGLEVAYVDVQNQDRVVMTTKCGRMYFWQGGTWSQIENVRAYRATINQDSIYYIDEIENVMKSGTDFFSKLGLTRRT